MDAVTLLLGAGIALGSAALGIIGEAAKGWLLRQNTNADKRTAFQHRTAVALQDSVFDLLRLNSQIYRIQVEDFNKTGQWMESQIPSELLDEFLALTARVRTLVERLDVETVRDQIEELLGQAVAVTHADAAKSAISQKMS